MPFLRNKIFHEEDRKLLEIEQGKRIKYNAERIWGWGTMAGKLRVKRRVNEILENMGTLHNPKVLELGCGVGIFTEQFIKNGINIVSLDISHSLLKLAKEKKGVSKILVADAELMPFKDGSFDLILGVSVLHHLNVENALKESKRVLKKGGMIILSEPNMANPQIFLQRRINWLRKFMHVTPTETAFFRWRLKSTLLKNGFKEPHIYPFEFLHPLTPKFLINFVRRFECYLEHLPFVREIAGSLMISAKVEWD